MIIQPEQPNLTTLASSNDPLLGFVCVQLYKILDTLSANSSVLEV